VTDDRQTTEHAAEKWVAIGEIACARAISTETVNYTLKVKRKNQLAQDQITKVRVCSWMDCAYNYALWVRLGIS